MRITLHRHGGVAAIPGLQLRVTVDTATLPKNEAAELEAAAQRADLARVPPVSVTPGAGDQRQYELVIEDGPETRSALLRDPIPTEGLRDLVKLLVSRSGAPN